MDKRRSERWAGGDGEREKGRIREGEGGEPERLDSGEGCRIWRQEAEICLQRWADMVYVGAIFNMVDEK